MAKTSFTGPVQGAYAPVVLVMSGPSTPATAVTNTVDYQLPAGMKMKISSVCIRAEAETATSSISVGNTTDPDGYVVAQVLTTNLGEIKMSNTTNSGVLANNTLGYAETSAGGIVRVTASTTNTDTFTNLSVTIHGWISEHQTTDAGSEI